MRNANRYRPLINAIRGSALLAASAAVPAAHADALTVVIENIQSSDGQIMIAIGDEASFGGEASADSPHAVRVVLPAKDGEVRFTTDVLPTGTYAAQAFHDVNGNGELNANFVGMPKEPWGFSNNARGNFGPPKFADTKFELNGETVITIRVEK